MKIRPVLRPLPLRIVFALFLLLAAFSSVQADVIDNVAWVLDHTSPNPFGITGDTLRNARTFFVCIDDGGDPIICYDSYFAPILEGQGIMGIPSWFSNFVSGYVAIVTENYWQLVLSWGETAYCAACNYITGVDVCNLVGAVIDVAEEAYAVVDGILQVFGVDLGDILDGAVDFASDLGSSLWCTLFECGDGGPTAEWYAAVGFTYMSPQIDTGIYMIKASDKSFDDWVVRLLDPLFKAYGHGGAQDAGFATAATMYRSAVDAKWTGEVIQLALIERPKIRTNNGVFSAIANSLWATFLNPTTTGAYAWPLTSYISNGCTSYLNNELPNSLSYYKQIDRWVATHTGSPNMKRNQDWCFQDFADQATKTAYDAEFAARAETYLANQLNTVCPPSGTSFICGTTGNESTCSGLMYKVGQSPTRCGYAATPKAQAAAAIRDYLKSKGAAPVTTSTGTPDKVNCSRPGQKDQCEGYYMSNYRNLPQPYAQCILVEDEAYSTLKQKVVQAVNSLNAAYGAGFVKFSGADPLLVRHEKGLGQVFKTMGEVQSRQQGETALTGNFGFVPPSTQPGFIVVQGSYTGIPFDGLSTPVMEVVEGTPLQIATGGIAVTKPEIAGQTAAQRLQNQIESGQFTNPVNSNPEGSGFGNQSMGGVGGIGGVDKGIGAGRAILGPGGAATIPGASAGGLSGGITGDGSGGFGPDRGLASASLDALARSQREGDREGSMLTGAAARTGAVQLEAVSEAPRSMAGSTLDSSRSLQNSMGTQIGTMNTMGAASGLGGAGQQGPGAPSAPAPNTTAPTSGPAPLPDLAAGSQVTIGGKTANWGENVALDASAATRRTNGICAFVLQYSVRNAGSAPAAPFLGAWSDGTKTWEKQFSSLMPGGSINQNESIDLKAGTQTLTLTLDPRNQVTESNENNNDSRLQVTVTGSCSDAPRPVSPAGPAAPVPSGPARPGVRTTK
jgi:hypothetical protein